METIQRYIKQAMNTESEVENTTRLMDRLERIELALSEVQSSFGDIEAEHPTVIAVPSPKKQRSPSQIEAYRKNFSKRWGKKNREIKETQDEFENTSPSSEYIPPASSIYDTIFR